VFIGECRNLTTVPVCISRVLNVADELRSMTLIPERGKTLL